MNKARRMLSSLLQKPALRQGSIVLADQGFISFATFATGAMLARATNKDEYSLYVLGLSLILFLQGFPRALVNVPFTIYAPHLSDADRNIYQASGFCHTLVLCVLVAAGMLALYLYDPGARQQSIRLSAMLPLLSIVAGSFFLRDFIRNALLARLQVWAGIAVNIVATAAQLTLIVCLFGLHRLTVANTFQIAALTSLIAAIYMLWSHRRSMQVVTARLRPDFSRALKTGRWILIDVFAYMGASQAYPWLLLYLLNSRTVAVFGVCSAFAGLTGPFLRGASAYIHPRMVHGYRNKDSRNLLRLAALSILVLSIPYGAWLLIGSLFAEELLAFIYGQSYSGYALLTMLLLLKATIEGVSSPLSNALQTLERADIVTVSLFLGMIITLGVGSILIAYFGLNGAGIAAAASSGVGAAWKWIMLRKIVRHKSAWDPSRAG